MSFNSLEYIIFLPIVAAAYFLLPKRLKNPLLLAASYLFYMRWKPAYALLMLLSTFVTYFCAIAMGRRDADGAGGPLRPFGRKGWLAACLILNLGILFLFKYFNFLAASLNALLAPSHGAVPILNVLLPVGISFYTFQALGYTIDVYRGDAVPERNFIDYALFVSFFPQLVAGPIERSGDILPQLKKPHRFSTENIFSGGLLILVGLAKKMIIADNLAFIVNSAYADPRSFTGVQLIFATVCFALQIYCDFSAYTDIARGSARLFGISLMENFNAPYFAASIRDFWRRWHISLSSWFKNYIYIPLGGSRVTRGRRIFNLLVVFVVSGIWHGAAWTFLLWGLIHGLYEAAGLILQPVRERLYSRVPRDSAVMRLLRIVFTFALVCLAWVMFRAESVSDALYIWRSMFLAPFTRVFPLAFAGMGLDRPMLIVVGVYTCLLLIYDLIRDKDRFFARVSSTVAGKYALALFLIFSIFLFGSYGREVPPQVFVYFQF